MGKTPSEGGAHVFLAFFRRSSRLNRAGSHLLEEAHIELEILLGTFGNVGSFDPPEQPILISPLPPFHRQTK